MENSFVVRIKDAIKIVEIKDINSLVLMNHDLSYSGVGFEITEYLSDEVIKFVEGLHTKQRMVISMLNRYKYLIGLKHFSIKKHDLVKWSLKPNETYSIVDIYIHFMVIRDVFTIESN